MPKGFIEYLIASYDAFERELSRDSQHIDVPFMKDEFVAWLEQQKMSAGTITSYVSNLKTMDKDLFLYEDDFFEGIKAIIETGYVKALDPFFDSYENVINSWKEDALKEDVGFTTKRLGDFVSTIRAYRRFFIDMFSQPQKKEDAVRYVPTEIFPFEDSFVEWLTKSRAKQTAKQYVSYIKRINRAVFVNICTTDPLIEITKRMSSNPESASDLLISLEEELAIEAKNRKFIPDMNQHSMDDCRTAFHYYVEFLSELMAENVDNAEHKEPVQDIICAKSRSISYDIKPIASNFAFRLRTQDRLSSHKDVFFPVRMISKLFTLKNKRFVEDEDATFNQWLKDSIDNIHLLTQTDYVALQDVTGLEIDPNKSVTATLKDGRHILLYTKTSEGGMKPLVVDKLKSIHIDHTPLISDVLEENKDKLPALARLTKDIKAYCEAKKVQIASGNYISIFNGVIQGYTDADLLNITSALKQDLDFIRTNTCLELMDAKDNLQKKC